MKSSAPPDTSSGGALRVRGLLPVGAQVGIHIEGQQLRVPF